VAIPSALFANISGVIVDVRVVSLQANALTIDFVSPPSTQSGMQNIELSMSRSKFLFSILRTGQVHIIEIIPSEVIAGIITPSKVAVQVSQCNQPRLLLDGNALSDIAVESSVVSDSLSVFVLSTFFYFPNAGLVNVTARFRCGISDISAMSVIRVVLPLSPSLFSATEHGDNSLNFVKLVLTSPSMILNLEKFVIFPISGHQQLPITLQSSTTRCAPSCVFLFSLQIPRGMSSLRYILQYSATGVNVSQIQTVSIAVVIRNNSETRILRVLPSIMDSRGGQLMFVSIISASVQNFSLTSPAFSSPFPCQILASLELTSDYMRSSEYTQLMQMFANEPEYLDLLGSSISSLKEWTASSVAVLMSPSLPFNKFDSEYKTILELSGQLSASKGFHQCQYYCKCSC